MSANDDELDNGDEEQETELQLPDGWEDWDYLQREDWLEENDELPDEWDGWPPEQQEAWMDDYEGEEVPVDPDETDDTEPTVDVDEILDEFDMEVEVDELFVEPELELVGEEEISISIAGIGIPGAYSYTIAGEGTETQYLREIESGGGSDAVDDYDADPDAVAELDPGNGEGDTDNGENGATEPDVGEEPPLQFVIQASMSQETAEELVDLRDRDETFEITVDGETYDDMELHDFTRTLSGERPYAYDTSIEVVEWREYEIEGVQDYLDNYTTGSSDGSGPTDPVEEAERWDESGTLEDPNEIEVPEGEQRDMDVEGEDVENVEIDAESPGSEATLNMTNRPAWRVRRVGFRGNARVTARGDGTIERVYIPGNEPAILSDSDQIHISDVYIDGGEQGIVAIHEADTSNSTAADGGGYEVITVHGRQVFHVDSNETFENVLFDQRASGAAATLIAKGTDWTVRNVGWLGPMSGTHRTMGIADTGNGESLIENVYIGDGVVGHYGDRSDPSLGPWVDPAHNGHIEFRNVYVEGAHDNAIYASAPGHSGAGGSVDMVGCYTKDNWVTHYRTAGGEIRDCVAVNSSSGRDGRCVWVWDTDGDVGEVTIENCHFIGGSYPRVIDMGRPGGTSNVTVRDCEVQGAFREHPQSTVNLTRENIGSNPQDQVPVGCPTSAEQAAAGDVPDHPESDDPDDLPDIDEYDVVELDEGEHLTVSIGPGELLHRTLFNVQADDCALTIRARGDLWAIKHVAVEGVQDLGDSPPCFSLDVATPDGGRGEIRNFYLGDGSWVEPGSCGTHAGTNRGRSGIYVPSGHEGTISISEFNASGWPGFGIHAGRAVSGRLSIDRAYMTDNGLAFMRLGGEANVTNSVFVHDHTGYDPTGFELETDDVTFENCHFTWDDADGMFDVAAGAGADLVDCEFDPAIPDDDGLEFENAGTSPQTEPTPVMPEMADDVFSRGSMFKVVREKEIRIEDVYISGTEDFAIRVGSTDPEVEVVLDNVNIDSNGYGIIAEGGNVTVRNSDIRGSPPIATTDGGSVATHRTRTGPGAEPTVPDRVPLSSREASGLVFSMSDPGNFRG